MTEGADIFNGISMDQLYAQRFGQETPMPSMQVCIEDVGSLTGACGYGYSCVYANTISWASPTTLASSLVAFAAFSPKRPSNVAAQ